MILIMTLWVWGAGYEQDDWCVPPRRSRHGQTAQSDSLRDAPGKPFTHKQGQYLAFIHAYMRLNRQPPLEIDMQRYFQVSPPSVHRMVLTLEREGFIRREPEVARSINVALE
jgi:DNA-binding MarR family transcriptional regulator